MASASSWYGIDCSASGWSWLDPGCIIQGAGASVGSAIGAATAPITSELNTLLILILVAAVVIILIVGFAPNVKHIVPHFV